MLFRIGAVLFNVALNCLQTMRRDIALGMGVFGNQYAICGEHQLALGAHQLIA